MTGQDGPDISLPKLSPTTVATDLIYAPLQTPFLKLAGNSGAKTVDGLGMLLHQARPGFQQWYGRSPEVTAELREVVLGSANYIP